MKIILFFSIAAGIDLDRYDQKLEVRKLSLKNSYKFCIYKLCCLALERCRIVKNGIEKAIEKLKEKFRSTQCA